jgi:hypothetical protein
VRWRWSEAIQRCRWRSSLISLTSDFPAVTIRRRWPPQQLSRMHASNSAYVTYSCQQRADKQALRKLPTASERPSRTQPSERKRSL